MFISMQILLFYQEPSAPDFTHCATLAYLHIHMAHCVSLGVLWLDVKVDNKKISFNIIFFRSKSEISNS